MPVDPTPPAPLTAAELDALERRYAPGDVFNLISHVQVTLNRADFARLLAAARLGLEAERLRAEVTEAHKRMDEAGLPSTFGPLDTKMSLTERVRTVIGLPQRTQYEARVAAWKARAERAEARLKRAVGFDFGNKIGLSVWPNEEFTVFREGREAEECGELLGRFAADQFDEAWAAAERAAKEGE